MGMSIDEAIGVSKTCQYILSNQVGSNWCKSKYDAVTIAISTMRKYQQIEQIYKEWFSDAGRTSADAYTKIGEVIKDGNVD